jgi:tRNA-dihydrouridine synthase
MAKRAKQPTIKQMDKLFHTTKALPPVITEKQLDSIEQRMADPNDQITRRAALILITRPAKWLFDTVENDRTAAVAFAQVGDVAEKYAKFLDELAQIVRISSTRIMVALCSRADMQSVINEAKEKSDGD